MVVNPKSEIRNPEQFRISIEQCPNLNGHIRYTFEQLSFGFRISDFPFKPQPGNLSSRLPFGAG